MVKITKNDILYIQDREINSWLVSVPNIDNTLILFENFKDCDEIESFLIILGKGDQKNLYVGILEYFYMSGLIFELDGCILDYSNIVYIYKYKDEYLFGNKEEAYYDGTDYRTEIFSGN